MSAVAIRRRPLVILGIGTPPEALFQGSAEANLIAWPGSIS